MTISSLSSSSLFAARIFNASTARASHLTKQLAANSRVLTAADDPSAIGRIESLKSRVSETRILAGLAPSASVSLKGFSSELAALRSLAADASSSTDLRALVDSIRSVVASQVSDGVRVFAGDPLNPEMTTVTTPATSGYVQGAARTGTTSLAADRYVVENGSLVGKASFSVQVDGTSHAVAVNAGSYTREQLTAAVSSAISAQTTLVVGSDVDVALSGNGLRLTSLSTGSTSTVSVSGAASAALGFAGATSVAGEGSTSEQVPGPAGSLSLQFAGRTVSFANLDRFASELESALDGGDLAAADSVRSRLVGALDSTQSGVSFAVGRLEEDVTSYARRGEVLSSELDNLTKLDRSEATMDLLRAQLQMEQSAWAMQQVQKTQEIRTRGLLGLLSQ